MIIIDVGAGDGRRCIRWLETFNKCLVYAFEPDPRQYKKLEQTRKKLKLEDQRRFKLINAAVWESNGEIDFYLCNDETSSSALPFVSENIKKWKYPPGRYYFKTIDKIKVQCMRLDSVCKREHIDVIDFMRIDAQGCAKEVLRGAGKMLRTTKEIYVKVHVNPMQIYENQTHRDEIENIIGKLYFEPVHIESYSRAQEAWIRYHSDVWKRTRGSKIYSLD